MMNLYSLKQQKKENIQNGHKKKAAVAQIRIQRDINELNLPETCVVEFPNVDDLFNFRMILSPDEGFYRGGHFLFNFQVDRNYPFDPPKVKCATKIYHPNIDMDGNVCLNILREDWRPVLTINSIVLGLQFLFLEPNPEDPLNQEAADVLQNNQRQFEKNVKRTIAKYSLNTSIIQK